MPGFSFTPGDLDSFPASLHFKHVVLSILRVWSVESGECLREFQGHSKEITAAEFSSNGRFVISSSVDGTVMIWEVDWDWNFDDKDPA